MMRRWRKGILLLLVAACLLSVPVRAEETGTGYEFVSVDGETVSTKNGAGKYTLLIYEHLSEAHSDPGKLIRELVSAEWIGNPNVNVVIVDLGNKNAQELKQFVAPYTDGNTDITFCPDTEGAFYDILMAAADGDAFSSPMGVLFGPDGQVIDHVMAVSSEKEFRELMAGHVAGIAPVPTVELSVTGENGYADAFRIVELINTEREKEGLSAVKMDKELLAAAMLRAAECSVYYSHTRPDGTQCFTAFPEQSGSSGENIAIGQQSPEEVMHSWMNSPGHRANIMSEDFNSVGVGVFECGGVHTWVQLFSSETATAVKKPADAKKTVKVKTLPEHLVPQVGRALLMLQKNETQTVACNFPNREFDAARVEIEVSALSFASSDPKIATVDSKGVVRGVADGTVQITVTLKGTDKKAVVTVVVSEHDYEEWKYEAPTCSAPGSARYRCLDCDEWIDMEVAALAAHAWDGGAVTKMPTTEKAGQRLYTCENCGKTKTESIAKYPAHEPVPTQPPTKEPTTPATKAPTAAVTKAPTVPETAAPTAAPTEPATQPATAATEPTAIPVPEPTEVPTESLPSAPAVETTEPAESSPELVPDTQPQTQAPTEPDNGPVEQPGNKLIIGIIVAAMATLAAGAFLIFWKRRK